MQRKGYLERLPWELLQIIQNNVDNFAPKITVRSQFGVKIFGYGDWTVRELYTQASKQWKCPHLLFYEGVHLLDREGGVKLDRTLMELFPRLTHIKISVVIDFVGHPSQIETQKDLFEVIKKDIHNKTYYRLIRRIGELVQEREEAYICGLLRATKFKYNI